MIYLHLDIHLEMIGKSLNFIDKFPLSKIQYIQYALASPTRILHPTYFIIIIFAKKFTGFNCGTVFKYAK